MASILGERSRSSFPVEFLVNGLDGFIDFLYVVFIDPIVEGLHFKSRRLVVFSPPCKVMVEEVLSVGRFEDSIDDMAAE